MPPPHHFVGVEQSHRVPEQRRQVVFVFAAELKTQQVAAETPKELGERLSTLPIPIAVFRRPLRAVVREPFLGDRADEFGARLAFDDVPHRAG